MQNPLAEPLDNKEWVEREARYAMRRQKRSLEGRAGHCAHQS